ncbi:enoyl-CoA hydratase [Mycolicibacterium conceptionense]|uniref:Probable enoyl-CoA hydratase EchA17 n=1 Tax=Mycolicibacterium conceptionense TaxID=451644 RepID=A0A1A2V1M7_9MYCO|nr:MULTISPECIES: enoyl-CoA hydratase [Mycolicibacterium]MCW1823373.1 enoyl-CoA hydratase [Mycolicibacterium senegalense]OBB11508.1 enoyl-CoA hydratase [Mycolicibacterium conceptionense]OBF07040.1 enoyl-CoA hydratase [Mycolicibacterium conceptionense]OBF26542.1 enoyl-CoA hydratase [Mycolicibacterium conceptionense]OBH94701.1 enoyl-CoA hydratase [Mycolicibacterium conceptionense]
MNEFVRAITGVTPEQDRVGTLMLSRPPTNALTRQMYREIIAAARDLGERTDISAVILFGGHEIFCAGDDVPELRTLNAGEAAAADAALRQCIEAVAAIPKPTVAAITGYALGTGLSLAMAADWRISGDNVKFGATEILAGLAPRAGGGARLAEVIGASKAKELVFSGRFVGAEEALELGLIDQMVAPDHVYDEALAWAQRFIEHPVDVLAAAKAAVDKLVDRP